VGIGAISAVLGGDSRMMESAELSAESVDLHVHAASYKVDDTRHCIEAMRDSNSRGLAANTLSKSAAPRRRRPLLCVNWLFTLPWCPANTGADE